MRTTTRRHCICNVSLKRRNRSFNDGTVALRHLPLVVKGTQKDVLDFAPVQQRPMIFLQSSSLAFTDTAFFLFLNTLCIFSWCSYRRKSRVMPHAPVRRNTCLEGSEETFNSKAARTTVMFLSCPSSSIRSIEPDIKQLYHTQTIVVWSIDLLG